MHINGIQTDNGDSTSHHAKQHPSKNPCETPKECGCRWRHARLGYRTVNSICTIIGPSKNHGRGPAASQSSTPSSHQTKKNEEERPYNSSSSPTRILGQILGGTIERFIARPCYKQTSARGFVRCFPRAGPLPSLSRRASSQSGPWVPNTTTARRPKLRAKHRQPTSSHQCCTPLTSRVAGGGGGGRRQGPPPPSRGGGS